MQEHPLRVRPLVGALEVGDHRAQCRHELAGVRILLQQFVEIRRGESVDDDVAGRARRIEHRSLAIELIDTEQIARAADVAQLGVAATLVPERYGPLLNDEDVRLVRLPLPQDEFVGLVEPHASVRRERHEIQFVHRGKRRVLLQKIGDAVADG